MITYLERFIIPEDKEFAVHPEATHYSIKGKNIRFYRVNPRPTEKMEPIPRGSNTIQFPDYREFRHWISYGSPEFKGHR